MTCLNLEGQLTCTACVLRSKCKRVVPGHGNVEADIMFVAEAPGADEDQEGIPLVGRAGQLFDRLLERAGLQREDVYVTNVVKCRPPKNSLREYPAAIHTCPGLWLTKELEMIDPQVLVVMGATAGQLYFPGTNATDLATLSRAVEGGMRVTGSFHPAHALPHRGGKEVEDSIVRSFERAKELAR